MAVAMVAVTAYIRLCRTAKVILYMCAHSHAHVPSRLEEEERPFGAGRHLCW